MSAASTPITPQAFAEALKSLPLSSLYAKGSELRNSIAHLQRSNDELARYIAEESPDGHDKDCEDAIKENEVVIVRMQERIDLLKVEVERRGKRWSEEMEMDIDIDGDGDMNGGAEGDVGVGVGVADSGPTGTGTGTETETETGSGINAGNNILNGDAQTTTGQHAQPLSNQNNSAASAGRNGSGGDDEMQGSEAGVYL
ncbi:hypothetical protein RJZ56_002476 [Blastomyces dermatitidis]|uniref:Uncharacterized protein n=3 Tax=Blastomyces TaxID=229219 RepID=A0A179UKZ4_BLAGS|nr:uncharacterized protein BDBG_03916 [Blastomyces gilchristii SLH14081]XP_045274321.1 uncharacterized protein BDCG_01987 [Blastomyces dermatitidis ER-3]EGE79663.1 hypothetical protein BDDG_02604 [Blastomyces dermatitidis ATCC 18188]EQL34195.1 hypothetical protein BDFG_03865 [Blastomyces dermatitidis ATCC 26199]EEQ86867.1 hypothetical protein BDCG_01987 [Blastomyces dermatitidis ER-3]OAT07899.1 hypothetical protein BDBG_03916 [Blastomyces gilchristii SLH14081]